MKFHCFTLGCKVNQYETQAMEQQLVGLGHEPSAEADSDVLIVNTCTVTAVADRKNRTLLHRLRREHPDALLGVCGCYSQISPEEAAKTGADVVSGSGGREEFLQRLLALWREKEAGGVCRQDVAVDNALQRRTFECLPAGGMRERTRAMLKVQDGCNNFCSYCIVPYVRGRERSRQPEDVLKECRELIAAGYKEITLLGQNVNSYGKDLDTDVSFADLIAMINDIPGEFLIRFMTSHPKDATEELFRTMAECEKCAHQLHLPVQSGSDRILKAMNRHYDSEKYLQKVELARSYMPDLVLTTDIIVGFPNETEEDFEETLKLCEKVRYDAMFTFIYSKRVGTPAAEMPDPYSREDKQKHFDRLLDVANRISAEKHREYEGKTVRVLVDGETGKEQYNLSSRTNGGRLVHLKGSKELLGRFINVKITGSNTWALYGEPETED